MFVVLITVHFDVLMLLGVLITCFTVMQTQFGMQFAVHGIHTSLLIEVYLVCSGGAREATRFRTVSSLATSLPFFFRPIRSATEVDEQN